MNEIIQGIIILVIFIGGFVLIYLKISEGSIEKPKKKEKSNFRKSSKLFKIKKNTSSDSLIIKFLSGKISLAVSYWVYSILIPAVIFFIVTLSDVGGIQISIGLIGIAYSIFAFIGTWKSAGNYIKNSKLPFWGYTARVMLIVGPLSAIGNYLSGH
jgi:hypothetical protein